MYSVFLVLDDDKKLKDLLPENIMNCYEKSPTKIPFLVWRTATTSQATPAATAPTARRWDEDDAPSDEGASWGPNNTIVQVDDMPAARPSSA
jgi:hypothetical protein